jgi:hypothetical protein
MHEDAKLAKLAACWEVDAAVVANFAVVVVALGIAYCFHY